MLSVVMTEIFYTSNRPKIMQIWILPFQLQLDFDGVPKFMSQGAFDEQVGDRFTLDL